MKITGLSYGTILPDKAESRYLEVPFYFLQENVFMSMQYVLGFVI